MKQKSAKKHLSQKRTSKKSSLSLRYISISFLALVILFAGSSLFKATTKIHVLGTSTGPVFLADKGESDGQSTDNAPTSGPTGPTPSASGNGGNNTSGNNSGGSPTIISGGTTTQPASNTQVDCIGPDGKHFTTDFHNCQELNQKWGLNNFQFIPLGKSEDNQTETPEKPEPTQAAEHSQGKLEVQMEGNKSEFNLETAGTHIEMKQEDDGSISIKAKKADGTEVQLQTNALDQINESLKEKDIEVGTTSANGFAIRSGGVEAQTSFPLSVDPSTKTLAVTTPNGTTDVTVLPNQAVKSLLDQKVLSNILSTGNATTASAAAGTQTVGLTEVNNQPAFAIQGVSDKRLFGLFPVAFNKTVFVSAQNGQTLQTQESLINQILENLSF
ncbi:MAG TPA: hypothetical protein VFQ63_03715 [Patescibacteria group bacterium]|nr:hypothetical protein [Patescibacteria group bacterium]